MIVGAIKHKTLMSNENESALDNRMSFQDFKRLTVDERDYFIFDTLCRVDSRTAAFESKYAKAWVETVMKAMLGLTLTGVLGAILATVGLKGH